MRRVLILAAIMLITTLVTTPVGYISHTSISRAEDTVLLKDSNLNVASTGGSGDDRQAVAYLDKIVSNQMLSISNSYVDTSQHLATIDLSSYRIPGWTLYNAIYQVDNITAAPERETIGASATPTGDDNFQIMEQGATNFYYHSLAQEFYNQSHDGKLLNFTLLYDTPSYFPLQQNYAYFEVRSVLGDGSTNLLPVIPVNQTPGIGGTWENITANVILNADGFYWVVINGSLLQEFSNQYPEIHWFYEWLPGTYGPFETHRYNTDGPTWGSDLGYAEAILNYTYIPWNTTSNSAQIYEDAAEISLTINGTTQNGLYWSTASSNNITTLELETNQSVYVYYSLILWYKQDTSSTTNWNVVSSGSLADWNATTIISYPLISGNSQKILNVTIPYDWTPTGLYNSTNPSTNHTSFILSGFEVICFDMTSETWTLTFTAFNYITDIRMYDSLDSSRIWTEASIYVDLDIEARIEDGSSVNVTSGGTNLTVIHEGSIVYSPTLHNPSGLGSSFLWDISSASDNGTFVIEVFWTDGSEAGYLTKQLTVYYETTLIPDASTINANTDSSFEVRVTLDQTFDAIGIDSPDALVTYSWRTAINESLISQGAGVWAVTIDTSGNASGNDILTVYAVGFAIENRSVDITVALTHQTYLQLDWSSASFDWTETTNFSVDYRWSRDNSLIANADQLYIEIDSSPYTLLGTNGTYWIELNFTFDLGFHSIFVNVTEPGFDPATDTASFTITEALTAMTVDWEPANVTIDYTHMLNLSIDYTHTGVDVPAPATVNVTIDGTTYDLGYNGTDWVVSIAGTMLGPGVYDAYISAWLYGYQEQLNTTFSLNVTIAAGQLIVTPSWFANATDYVSTIILQIDVDYPNGTGVVDASVNADITGVPYIGIHIGGGVYNITLGPLVPLGLNDVNVTVTRTGWNPFSVISTLTVTETASTITATPSFIVRYFDQNIQVDIYYEMWNGTNLVGWTLDFDVNGSAQSSNWVTDHYQVTIQGSDIGVGSFICNATGSLYGFVAESDIFGITIEAIPTSVDVIGTLSIYVNSTLHLNVTFEDDRNGSPENIDTFAITWPSTYDSWTQIGPGLYELVLSSTALHSGTEPLQLVLNKTGYASNTTLWDIAILPVPTTLDNEEMYAQWENETIVVTARLRDTLHSSWVHWANLTLTFDGADYLMSYNTISGYYQVSIFLNSSFTLGDHIVTFSSVSTDCIPAGGSAIVRINEKATYVITITVPGQVEWGTTLGIEATVTMNDAPVSGIFVTVYARFNMTTNGYEVLSETSVTVDGVAQVNFEVLENSTHVEVWAEYSGSQSVWPAISDIHTAISSATPGLIQVLLEWIMRPEIMFLLIALVVVGAVAAVYRGEFRPKKRASQMALMRQLDAFRELDMMQHFMAVYIDRGTCVFYHPFKDARIQPDLISGFIAAITSVYGEIKGNGVQGSLEEINYQGLRLNSYSGKYIIGIVIVEGDMSERLRDRLQFFVELFEDQYKSDLDGWTGLVDCFDPEWVVSNLNTAFNYHYMLPHVLVRKAKVKGQEGKVYKHILSKFGDGEFLISGILEDVAALLGCTESEAYDIIIRLEDSGGIKPISIHTVLQRQGLGIAEEDDASLYGATARMEFDEPPAEEVQPIEEEPEPEPVRELEPEPEVVEAPEPVPPPEEEVEEISEEDKFLADVVALMEEEEKKKKKDKKKKD